MSSEAGVGSLKEREKEIKPLIKPAKDGRYSVTHNCSLRSLPNFGTEPNNTILPAMPKIEIEREFFFSPPSLATVFQFSPPIDQSITGKKNEEKNNQNERDRHPFPSR